MVGSSKNKLIIVFYDLIFTRRHKSLSERMEGSDFVFGYVDRLY